MFNDKKMNGASNRDVTIITEISCHSTYAGTGMGATSDETPIINSTLARLEPM